MMIPRNQTSASRVLRTTCAMAILCSLAVSTLEAQTAPAPKTPKGWSSKTVKGKQPHVAFTKDGLGSLDYLAVKYYQREMLVDLTLPQSIQMRLVEGRAPLGGTWTSPVQNLTRLTENMYTAERLFEADGNDHIIALTAVCVDKLHIRMSSLIMSQTPGAKNFDSQAYRLQSSILKVEIDSAKADKRGLSLEQNPPKVKSIKAGGKIKAGRYIGVSKSKKKNEAGARYDLVIFEDGEYEFLGRKRNNTGTFTYSVATGRLQIDEPFENDSYDWDEEFCIYGKNQKNETVIHAETNYWLTQLKWVEQSDRPSPSEIKRQKAIASAEAARFKHQTKPGEGISPDEIEAVMYSWETQFRSGALQLDHEGYLLLKDGRVHDGIPCAPDSWDLLASRSRDPDSWGWWEKVKNDKKGRYKFAWPVRPRQFQMPKGEQIVGIPFDKGAKLSGDYGAASTQVNIISNYSNVQWWGIKFDMNGRFLKYRNGSVQSGGVPGMETLSTTVWNDEGAVSAFSGPEVVGGTKSKNNNPASNRMGRYKLDGYRLTLKFDSGRVEHHATFTDKDLGSIWFQRRSLHKKKKK